MARELDTIIGWRGKPATIVSDNGTELTSNAILEWADQRKVFPKRRDMPYCLRSPRPDRQGGIAPPISCNRETVVDPDHIAVGISELDNEPVPVPLESIRGGCVDMEVAGRQLPARVFQTENSHIQAAISKTN